MKYNRNRLYCQFNGNRRLHMEIFTLHRCAMNRGCGGWASSFIIVRYGYVSGKAIYPSVYLKSRQSRGKHSVSSEFSLCSS